MKRYLKLFLSFAKNCFMGEMEFRANFFLWVAANLFWLGISLVMNNVIFGQIDTIAGWTKEQSFILVLLFNIYTGIMWISILPNIARFHELIRHGQLDFVLLKPVSSRFWVSTRAVEFDSIPRLVVSIVLLFIYIQPLHLHIPVWLAFDAIMISISSIIIFYNFYFIIMTMNFWATNIFNLENLIDGINDIGRYPLQIFKGALQFIFLFIIPIGFIATFPAQTLFGVNLITTNILSLTLIVASSIFSQWFWNFALKRYSSASS